MDGPGPVPSVGRVRNGMKTESNGVGLLRKQGTLISFGSFTDPRSCAIERIVGLFPLPLSLDGFSLLTIRDLQLRLEPSYSSYRETNCYS